MPVQPITDWGTAIVTSAALALAIIVGAIPKIFGFAIILIIDWLVAGLIATAVAAVLRAVKFNNLSDRAGLTTFVHGMGIGRDPAAFLADIAK
jgi:hypothetical protein